MDAAHTPEETSTESIYEYHREAGKLIPVHIVEEFAVLYSAHYGVWSGHVPRAGQRVELTPMRLKLWLTDDSSVVWACCEGKIVGYAITVQSAIEGVGKVAWVTQLVVHEEHRQKNVGKNLLFSAWRFTNFFAWGLLSANPYAVRALEKATRRTCQPDAIRPNAEQLRAFGVRLIHYVTTSAELSVDHELSRMNTEFFVDHSGLPEMLRSVQANGNPWNLGDLPEGWEWFAFTFQNQEIRSLSPVELENMLRVSDQVTRTAYARMLLDSPRQRWASHTKAEVDFIVEQFSSVAPKTILDCGCGLGRHSLELAKRGFSVTGVDYVSEFIDKARQQSAELKLENAIFCVEDCTRLSLDMTFDAAICLYDVVGSYADKLPNRAILRSLFNHVAPGGLLLLSVMNLEVTVKRAVNVFRLNSDPDRLLTLEPSEKMETTGDVFDPRYYMVDLDSYLIYRKEQFRSGDHLPEELIVRDRRYWEAEIDNECTGVGFEVLWTRCIRSGHWDEPLASDDEHAKEILVLCRRPADVERQMKLF